MGLFYVGMIATVMSTIDSYGFIAAGTIGRDLIWRLRGDPDETQVARYTRAGLWVACGFAAVLALANPSVIGLWHDLGSITTPVLLLPVGTALLGRGLLPSAWTVTTMLAAFAVSLAWVLAKTTAPGGAVRYPWGIEPIYAGLGLSLALYLVGWALEWARRRAPARRLEGERIG
jgi:SSS family solute:Na+ symporter